VISRGDFTEYFPPVELYPRIGATLSLGLGAPTGGFTQALKELNFRIG